MTAHQHKPDVPAAEHDRVPFLDQIGARFVDLGEGRGRMSMTVGPHHLRNLGIMHGGVLAALLDSVMGMAVGSRAPDGCFVVTVQLSVNFIRPAWEGETLEAAGEAQHVGRQTAVARGEVRTARGALVGTGSGTFMFLPHTDPARSQFARQEEEGPSRDRS